MGETMTFAFGMRRLEKPASWECLIEFENYDQLRKFKAAMLRAAKRYSVTEPIENNSEIPLDKA